METDFGDGCHPRHQSIPAYGWIRRGKEHALKSNSSRQHVNINGLINIDTHATCVDFPETVNAKTTIRLFKKLISRHDPKTVIHVFVDNARYYRAALLREFLSHTKIRLHFLPTYSPNLNPIERLW
ncbi:MAG: IS630 family transposase [Planctomycetia bacterium]|nr:IS630 family transposase [Planctomycetia bacterium]